MTAILGLLFFMVFAIIPILFLLSIVLWVVMIIHLIQNFDSIEDNILWVVVMVFGGFLGAIVYYFIVYKKVETKKPKSKSTK